MSRPRTAGLRRNSTIPLRKALKSPRCCGGRRTNESFRQKLYQEHHSGCLLLVSIPSHKCAMTLHVRQDSCVRRHFAESFTNGTGSDQSPGSALAPACLQCMLAFYLVELGDDLCCSYGGRRNVELLRV